MFPDRYWDERGFTTIVLARVLNLAALGFTVVLSGFLLIWVDWRALSSDCVKADTCDISEASAHSSFVSLEHCSASLCALAFAAQCVERSW